MAVSELISAFTKSTPQEKTYLSGGPAVDREIWGRVNVEVCDFIRQPDVIVSLHILGDAREGGVYTTPLLD